MRSQPLFPTCRCRLNSFFIDNRPYNVNVYTQLLVLVVVFFFLFKQNFRISVNCKSTFAQFHLDAVYHLINVLLNDGLDQEKI
jgi:hypothetical protein